MLICGHSISLKKIANSNISISYNNVLLWFGLGRHLKMQKSLFYVPNHFEIFDSLRLDHDLLDVAMLIYCTIREM